MSLLLALVFLTAPPWPSPPADTLVLTHATVVSMTEEGVLHDMTLVVSEGEIVRLEPTTSEALLRGAEVHDLTGKYVLPGLIDGHVHLREPDRSLVLFPAHGVTTVVNLEGERRHLVLRDSITETRSLAPRIVSSGPFLEERVETGEEAREEVRRQHAAGYDLVKIHGEMPVEAFDAALAEARALDLPVVAHHPDNIPTDRVLGSGLVALAHAEEIIGSSLLREPVDLSQDSAAAIGRALAESGTAVITTLAFFTGMREQATDAFYLLIRRPELAYVSPERRRAWVYDGHREYIEDSDLPWYEAAEEALYAIVRAVQEAGGTVIAGTDTPLEFTIPGISLLHELDHLVRAGFTPLEALRAATVASAALIERPDLGRIEVGAAADLVVVGADPTESVAPLRRPEAVVLRGQWASREVLDRRLDELAAAYAREEVVRAARERVLHAILAAARSGGVEAAAEIERLSDLAGAPAFQEGDLNELGYRLLADGRVDQAVRVFRLNVRRHPESANVYDSLGEAYLSADKLDLAEQNYRRALAIDPRMDSARRGLEEISRRRGGRGA